MKRPGLICVIYTIAVLLLSASCKDFIEPSIENRQVYLQAPSDHFQSTLYKVSFWWDEVEDALGYRLQIASPGFNAADRLVLDTLVSGNKFSVNLDPGKYEWRLRGENGSSVTAYSSSRAFEVVQSSIKQQSVELSSPADNLLTNNGRLTLKWGTLYGATMYRLQIDTNNFTEEDKLILDQTLPVSELAFTIPKDQVYQWRVRAENDTAQARWSGGYRFTVDRVPPARVKAASPVDNQNIAKPVNLQWNAAATAVRYRLYILKADSVTSYNADYPVIVNTNSYALQAGTSGERVYWKVAAIDAAGNEGQTSIARSFTIQ